MQELESRHKGYKIHTDLWRHDETPQDGYVTAEYWEKKEGGRLIMFINENLMFWHLKDDDIKKYSYDEINQIYENGNHYILNDGANCLCVFEDRGHIILSPRRLSDIIDHENGRFVASMYGYKRKATTEEAEQWREFYKEDQTKAIDRLKKYYKRYSDKIHTRTYWADR